MPHGSQLIVLKQLAASVSRSAHALLNEECVNLWIKVPARLAACNMHSNTLWDTYLHCFAVGNMPLHLLSYVVAMPFKRTCALPQMHACMPGRRCVCAACIVI